MLYVMKAYKPKFLYVKEYFLRKSTGYNIVFELKVGIIFDRYKKLNSPNNI
jgi:hypothetical protein